MQIQTQENPVQLYAEPEIWFYSNYKFLACKVGVDPAQHQQIWILIQKSGFLKILCLCLDVEYMDLWDANVVRLEFRRLQGNHLEQSLVQPNTTQISHILLQYKLGSAGN